MLRALPSWRQCSHGDEDRFGAGWQKEARPGPITSDDTDTDSDNKEAGRTWTLSFPPPRLPLLLPLGEMQWKPHGTGGRCPAACCQGAESGGGAERQHLQGPRGASAHSGEQLL